MWALGKLVAGCWGGLGGVGELAGEGLGAVGGVEKIHDFQIFVDGFRPRFEDGIRPVILFSYMGHLLQAYGLDGIRTAQI